MLERLVNYLMVSKTVEHVFLNQQLLVPSKKVPRSRLLNFLLLVRVKKERALLAAAYF